MKYPIVKKIVDNVRGLNAFEEETNTVFSKRDKEILLEFPTVYIHNWKNTKNYPVNETDHIFHYIWQKLRSDNEEVFPSEERIKDSAVFKASPLHRLTDEQLEVKEDIIRKVFESIHKNKSNQLIFVEGEAGTGKTVLNSSTFYDIYLQAEKEGIDFLK